MHFKVKPAMHQVNVSFLDLTRNALPHRHDLLNPTLQPLWYAHLRQYYSINHPWSSILIILLAERRWCAGKFLNRKSLLKGLLRVKRLSPATQFALILVVDSNSTKPQIIFLPALINTVGNRLKPCNKVKVFIAKWRYFRDVCSSPHPQLTLHGLMVKFCHHKTLFGWAKKTCNARL